MDFTEIAKLHGVSQLSAIEEGVIARLIKEEPQVLVISDEGFLSAITRAEIRTNGISIWLRPDQANIVSRHNHAIFAEAAFTIDVEGRKSDLIVKEIVEMLGYDHFFETPDEADAVDRRDWTFGRLLNWHLRRGSRPDRGARREWSLKELASDVRVSTRAVQNWIAEKNVPSDLATIERALFGDNPTFRYLRVELRETYYRSLELRGSRRGVPPPADAIPNAEPRALQFTSAATGAIDLTPVTELGELLQQGQGRREDYSEVRLKASDLSALGLNRLGRLSGPISRFLSLPEDIKQVRAKLFWSRANTLRILWQDHVSATADRAHRGEPDDRLLEASAASQLKDLVETLNVFAVGDPLLMDLDAVRPGPQEDEAAREEVAILAPVIEDVIANPQIATARAREVVGEQLSNVGAPSDSLARRQGNDFARRSFRNFVGELVRRAYGPVRSFWRATKAEPGNLWKGVREGAYRATGAALLSDAAGFTDFSSAFVKFVVRHAEALSLYVAKAFQNPTLVEIIQWIVRLGG